VSKDEWDTKKDNSISIKNALYTHGTSGMAKRTSWAEATPKNEKKIKSAALAIVELHWCEGISQSGRQLISRKFF